VVSAQAEADYELGRRVNLRGTDAVVDACRAVRTERGLTSVACSGGVFQNALLLGLVVDGLEAEGFRVLLHSRVPPNDGGISLGQAACAGARDRQTDL